MKMKRRKFYAVIYRTGGRERFQWRRVLTSYASRDAAQEDADMIERMGYKTLIHDAHLLDSIGMPEGWDASGPLPDANCSTLPNGDCIGSDCMHDPK